MGNWIQIKKISKQINYYSTFHRPIKMNEGMFKYINDKQI